MAAPILSDAAALAAIPYCGAPPTPATLAYRWNLDPVLISLLLLAGAAYWALAARGEAGRAIPPWRRACFAAGWAIGSLAVISPLCPLSVALFSARVGQHLILTMAAAPLIALGRPDATLAAAMGRAGAWRRRTRRPLTAAAVFAMALWFWHSPGPYAATFQGDAVYWLMHATTFGAAVWLWSSLLDGAEEGLAGFVSASGLTATQMALLGAVITFAARPLYAPHLLTTFAFGLTPLEDQQLGGVLMWVPAGVLLTGALGWAFLETLRRAERRALTRASA